MPTRLLGLTILALAGIAHAQTTSPRAFISTIAKLVDAYEEAGSSRCAQFTQRLQSSSYPKKLDAKIKFVSTISLALDDSVDIAKYQIDSLEGLYDNFKSIDPWLKNDNSWIQTFFSSSTPDYFYAFMLTERTGAGDNVQTDICVAVLAPRKV